MSPTVADVTVTAFVEVPDRLPNATELSKSALDVPPIAILFLPVADDESPIEILPSPLANAKGPCANDAHPLAFDL